jgi:hypothetical protein
MALNYDLTRIKNYKKLWEKSEITQENTQMKEPYRTIIFCTMIVGMREITEENCTKFHERVSFVEKTNGSFFYKNKKPLYISAKDINRMIGLQTNASLLTKAQFIKRHTQDLKI